MYKNVCASIYEHRCNLIVLLMYLWDFSVLLMYLWDLSVLLMYLFFKYNSTVYRRKFAKL